MKKTKDCFALTFFNINKEQIIAYGQFDLFPVLSDDEPFKNREWAGIVSYRLKDVISNLELPGGEEEMHIHINDDEWKVGHFSSEGFTVWAGEPYEKILQEIKIKSLGYV